MQIVISPSICRLRHVICGACVDHMNRSLCTRTQFANTFTYLRIFSAMLRKSIGTYVVAYRTNKQQQTNKITKIKHHQQRPIYIHIKKLIRILHFILSTSAHSFVRIDKPQPSKSTTINSMQVSQYCI